ncbi:MAG: RNA methyltransferase [Acidobacteria bacterium]|nr:RNA methyltransferase [Acidobacteriota bacterium]
MLYCLTMLVEKITSKQNPLIKRFRRVRSGDEHHLIFIEGIRLIEEALKAGVHFESIAYSLALEANERGAQLQDDLLHVPCRGALVPQQILDAIADTETPQGIVAIASRPHFELADVFNAYVPLILVADELQDPGNIGTIIRTAEAAGASGVVTTRHTVDPYNLKALRASMGSAFRLPVASDIKRADLLKICNERGVKIVASRLPVKERGVLEDAAIVAREARHTEADFTQPLALVLGREVSGVSEEMTAQADTFVHIPMAEGIESLNVAAAATVLLYEAARQRGFQFPLSQPRQENSNPEK